LQSTKHHYDISKMIDPEMLAAILKELGYFDEDEDKNKTDKIQSETQEHEQNNEQKID